MLGAMTHTEFDADRENGTGRSSRRSRAENSDLGVASMCGGVVAWVFALIPGWGVAALGAAAFCVALALASVLLPRRSRLVAIIALVLGLLAGLWVVTPWIEIGRGTTDVSDGVDSDVLVDDAQQTAGADDSVTVAPGELLIEYQVWTDGDSVTHLSYVDIADGDVVMVDKLGVPAPFTHAVVVPKDQASLGDFSVTGMGGSYSTTTTCSVSVDGEVVHRQRASGAYGLVSCVIPSD